MKKWKNFKKIFKKNIKNMEIYGQTWKDMEKHRKGQKPWKIMKKYEISMGNNGKTGKNMKQHRKIQNNIEKHGVT